MRCISEPLCKILQLTVTSQRIISKCDIFQVLGLRHCIFLNDWNVISIEAKLSKLWQWCNDIGCNCSKIDFWLVFETLNYCLISYLKKLWVKSNNSNRFICFNEPPDTATIPLKLKSSFCSEFSPINASSAKTSIWLWRNISVISFGKLPNVPVSTLENEFRSRFRFSKSLMIGRVFEVNGPLMRFECKSSSRRLMHSAMVWRLPGESPSLLPLSFKVTRFFKGRKVFCEMDEIWFSLISK